MPSEPATGPRDGGELRTRPLPQPARRGVGTVGGTLRRRAAQPVTARPASGPPRPAHLWLLGALSAFAGAWFFAHGRGLTFYYDEWAFVMDRRAWNAGAFLEPHNEHLHLTPALGFKVLFATAGLDDYDPYRLLVIVAHLAVGALVFALARRRIGDTLALLAVIPVLFLGSGSENIVWPFQIGVVLCLAAGLGAFLALERRSAGGDALAAALLTVAFASASLAVAIALGVAAELLWSRRGAWRRLWVVAVPASLYAAWSVAYGRSALLASNAPAAPEYMADAASAAAGGLTGLGPEWGRVLFLLGAIGLGLHLVRHGASPRLAGLVVAAVSSWALTALARAHLGEPGAGRYVYVGAVFVVLIAAEVVPRVVVPPRALALLGALVALSLVGNYGVMRGGLDHMRSFTQSVTASLAALELAGPSTARDFRPEPVRAPNLHAGGYFEAVAQYGSPAASFEELLTRGDPERQQADWVYVMARGVQPEQGAAAGGSGEPPTLVAAHWGTATTSGSCVRFLPTQPAAAVDLELSTNAFAVTLEDNEHASVHLRLFADDFPAEATFTVPGASSSRVELPPPVAGREWHVRIFSTEQALACSTG